MFVKNKMTANPSINTKAHLTGLYHRLIRHIIYEAHYTNQHNKKNYSLFHIPNSIKIYLPNSSPFNYLSLSMII